MIKNNPTKGLLMYSFYSSKGNLSIGLLIILAFGAGALISGNNFVFDMFLLASIGIFPYLIMMAMGGKDALLWEKFRASMPVKRKNLVALFYLSVILATIAGLLIGAVILGIIFIVHEDIMHNVIKAAFGQLAYPLGVVLLMTGLVFPIGSTKFGASRGEVFFTICLLVAAGVILLVSALGNILYLPSVVMSLSMVGVGAVALVISYQITNRIYAKMDF